MPPSVAHVQALAHAQSAAPKSSATSFGRSVLEPAICLIALRDTDRWVIPKGNVGCGQRECRSRWCRCRVSNCWQQDVGYQNVVLGDTPRIGIEAASGFGWESWLYLGCARAACAA